MNTIKKYFARALLIAVFLLGAILIYRVFDYLLVVDTSAQTRVTLHDMYEEEIDEVFFVGTSHIIHTVNAAIIT